MATRNRISDEIRHYESVRSTLDKLAELSDAFLRMFFVDWAGLAKSKGKEPVYGATLLLDEVKTNRHEAAEVQRTFGLHWTFMWDAVEKHPRFLEIRDTLPSIVFTFQPQNYRFAAEKYLKFGEPDAIANIERATNAIRDHYITWIAQAQRRSLDNRVDLGEYVPDNDLFNLKDILTPFLFQDVVTSKDAQMYFLNESLSVIHQGIDGAEKIVAPVYLVGAGQRHFAS